MNLRFIAAWPEAAWLVGGGAAWVLIGALLLLAAVAVFIAWATLETYAGGVGDAVGKGKPTGHEEADAQPRVVLGFVVILVVTVLLIVVTALGIYRAFDVWNRRANQATAGELLPGPTPPPRPALQRDPEEDLNRFRQREDGILNSYGWVNRSAGIVHIPIQRAMELLLEQGAGTPAAGAAAGRPAPAGRAASRPGGRR